MPLGDRTGPWRLGPMTGRAMGYCAGYPVPGFMNPGPWFGFGRGFGLGRGFGRGFGLGRGRGWRGGGFWPSWGSPYPWTMPYGYPFPYSYPSGTIYPPQYPDQETSQPSGQKK